MLEKPRFIEYLDAGIVVDSLPGLVAYTRSRGLLLIRLFLDLEGVVYQEIDHEMLQDIEQKLYQNVHTPAEFEDKILQTLGNVHGVFYLSDIDPDASMATRCLEESILGLCSFARYSLNKLSVSSDG